MAGLNGDCKPKERTGDRTKKCVEGQHIVVKKGSEQDLTVCMRARMRACVSVCACVRVSAGHLFRPGDVHSRWPVNSVMQ